jgi:oxalate decarboxylase/phosphoglucose isomerase-like protein (cupin superfamily)
MNTFHNKEFVFDNPFDFRDRYDGQENYFSGAGRLYRSANLTGKIWETNFIRNMLSLDLMERKERGAGKTLHLEFADNSLSAHMAEFPVGTYRKAHRHSTGFYIVILSGEGYTLMWEEGQPISRYDWKPGSMIVPPENMFHQHFNKGKTQSKYLALHPRASRKHRNERREWKADIPMKQGGHQIEYEDEDPMIRETYEKELAKIGVECKLPRFEARR